jgi:uncharacterized protein YlxW (UPF0749 family)
MLNMLAALKGVQTDRYELEEMIALAAFAKTLRSEYEAHQVEEPEWLGEKIRMLQREIRSKNADTLAARRREVRARLDAMRTPDEKRAAYQKELEQLDAVLGVSG